MIFGVPIWSSENDERPYENEDNPKLCDQISLEKWIWQEIKRILFLTQIYPNCRKERFICQIILQIAPSFLLV